MRPFAHLTFLIIALIFLSGNSTAQIPPGVQSYDGLYLLETVVVDGDTIPVVTLRTTRISANRKARSKRYQREWDKLQRNVVKTYPYAQVAGELIREYTRNLQDLETEAEQKAYLDYCEDALKKEFESDLRKLTISQGRVLIKLIDRETGNTSYELIRDMRSGFTAFMWQGVAKLFGTDLKANYDPDTDEMDGMIEEIVERIEMGELRVKKREVTTPEARKVLEEKSKRLQRRIEREKRRLAKDEQG